MLYYEMKMYVLYFKCIGKLSHPKQILFTPASASDISVYKQAWSELEDRLFFGNKIYSDLDFNDEMMKKHNTEMLTPIK